jgi:predicted DNA binding CopG/RHH family protein
MRGYELDELEREILRKFERGELRNTPGIEREVEVALGAMPKEYTEISWLLSPCEMKLVRELAEKQGMSYQEWAADAVRKYLRGTLVEKVLPKMVNGEVDYQFDEEEIEILEAFKRGDWQSVPDLERELENARQAARNTLKNHTRVSMSLSPIELKIAIVKAERRGAPYSVLVSLINGKYLRGMLIDKGQPQAVTAGAPPGCDRRTR